MDFYDLARRANADYGIMRSFALQQADRFGLNASQVDVADYWPDWAVSRLLEMWEWAQPPVRLRGSSERVVWGTISEEEVRLMEARRDEVQRLKEIAAQRQRLEQERAQRLKEIDDQRQRLEDERARLQSANAPLARPVRIFDL